MRLAIVLALALVGQEKPAPLKVCLISGSGEYMSDASLGDFRKHLEGTYETACSWVQGVDKKPGLAGIEALETCDVMVLFTRRITLPEDQLARVQKHCRAGKPVVGIRTASHAFQNWLELDKEILGGNYTGHYGKGTTEVSIVEKAKDHPILAGVKPFKSAYHLYKNTGHAPDVELLLRGSDGTHTEPIAWTRVVNGGRVFYTSLGGPDDFKDENFRALLVNGIAWASQKALKKK